MGRFKKKPAEPQRRKTFRFEKFSERLANVNVDVFHKIGQRKETPDGVGTFFCESVTKWNELNCTESYASFKRELRFGILILPQVLLYKDDIVKSLERHLAVRDSSAYAALLEFVVALARDLQSDFYPYFPRFFRVIVNLLRGQDTELLENAFRCLAYLFKFLWRYMIKDIDNVYTLYSPILTSRQPAHIRNFASESISFLLRKVRDKNALVNLLFTSLTENPNMAEGVGLLLFDVVRGFQHRFNSNFEQVFFIVLTKLGIAFPENKMRFSWKLVYIAQEKMVMSLLEFTNAECSLPLWETLLKSIRYLQDKCSDPTKVTKAALHHLERLLKLFSVAVTYQCGRCINSLSQITETILSLLEMEHISEKSRRYLIGMVSSILFSETLHLNDRDITKLVSTIFDAKLSKKLKSEFVGSLYAYEEFEKSVLPFYLSYISRLLSTADDETKFEIVSEVVELILNFRHQHLDASNLRNWIPFLISFDSEGDELFADLLVSLLDVRNIHECVQTFWMSIVCLPHLKTDSTGNLLIAAKNVMKFLMQKCHYKTANGEVMFLLSQLVESFIHAMSLKELIETISTDDVKLMLLNYPTDVYCLRIADFYFTNLCNCNSSETLTESLASELFNVLQFNIASPQPQIRLFTLRIFCSFHLPIPNPNYKVDAKNIFEICLSAEITKIGIDTYRERIRHLQSLEHHFVEAALPIGHYETVPLLYAIGTLFINFRLIWAPAIQVIVSFANGMDSNKFWEIYLKFLSDAADRGENEMMGVIEDSNDDNTAVDPESAYCVVKSEIRNFDGRIDYRTHRERLWHILRSFVQVAEANSKDVVTLLFRCLKNECRDLEMNRLITEDLRQYRDYSKWMDTTEDFEEDEEQEEEKEEEEEGEMEEEERDDNEEEEEEESVEGDEEEEPEEGDEEEEPEEDELEESEVEEDELEEGEVEEELEEVDLEESEAEDEGEEEIEEEEEDEVEEKEVEEEDNLENLDVENESHKKPARVFLFKKAKRIFCNKLELFAKFQNPQFVYREPELAELYFYLLGYPSPLIQKAALDCILSYRHSFMNPYEENLLNLMNDKKFKDEIVLFSIDAEQSVVMESHRKQLMPYLMRILLGKMMRKPSSRVKDSYEMRQTIILQFLAASRAEEIVIYLDMFFLPFQPILEVDILSLVHSTMNNRDFSAVILLRKQQGVLNFLSIVFKKLSHQISSILPFLFKMIVFIAAQVGVLLEHRSEVGRHHVQTLKQIRTLTVTRLVAFFDTFYTYAYQKDEINAMFEAIVWPLIRFSDYLRGPLLKLFKTWCSNARYFVLLTKHHKNDVSVFPLQVIMNLLASKDAEDSRKSMILDMIKNLLTIDDDNRDVTVDYDYNFDEIERKPSIEVDDAFVPSADQSDTKVLRKRRNYGTLILLPHVPIILQRLKELLESRKKRTINSETKRNIMILCKLCEYVDDPEYCSSILSLLLPLFRREAITEEERGVNIFSLIKKMLEAVNEPSNFLSALITMFLKLRGQVKRSALCELITIIGDRHEPTKSLASLAHELNAHDARQTEEPDYFVRLKAFRDAVKIINDNETLDPLFWQLIMNNCIFFLKSEADFALQSNASNCLQQIAIAFGSFSDEKRAVASQFLKNIVLPEIRAGLKIKTERTRHEFISILGIFVKNCHFFSELSDLHHLSNEEDEHEFFANICNIQFAIRAKTLTNMCSKDRCKNMSQFVLINYMMPIVSSFLFDEDYAKSQALVDAAIMSVGYICRKLSWTWYNLYLTHYLDNLKKCADFQKTAVSVIVAVLDAFHFNLSLSKVEEKESYIPIRGIKRKRETSEVAKDEKKHVSDNPLPGSLATSIHETISKLILPRLYKCLSQKAKRDREHHLAATGSGGKYYAEDEEILRVPLALAMVKLLKHLPVSMLESRLPGILLKVCDFLKSRSDKIRLIARKIVQAIMLCLGPKYMHYLVTEMRRTLTRGYQVHVMIFTINAIFQKMHKTFSCGDLDTCIVDVQKICNDEMFGTVAEEKTVGAIVKKWKEANGVKSYTIYEVLAKFVSESCLTDLIVPLKDVLAETTSHRDVFKIQQCLRNVSYGLLENTGVSSHKMLIFIFGIVSERIPEFNNDLSEINKTLEKPKIDKHRIRPDTFLIPKEPGRNKAQARTSTRTNAHVLVEFGIKFLNSYVKNNKIGATEKEVLQKLDPFIPMLSDCLQSTFIQLTTASLHCLMAIFKLPLPSRNIHISSIISSTFALLKKYCRAGMAQGDNFNMVMACFQLLTVIVRDIHFYDLGPDQYKILLGYIEQDVNDQMRHATAFGLLKAILSTKIQMQEINDVMKQVSEMMITSEAVHIRVQCRQALLQYLLDYPTAKKLPLILQYIVTQLEYSLESGRESALEMVTSIFTAFPIEVLCEHSVLFFVPMAARIINDSSVRCKKMAAIATKILLERVTSQERDKLFSVVTSWLTDKNPVHKKLSAQLCGLFVEVEKQTFEKRLAEFLPILTDELKPEKHKDFLEESLQLKSDHVLFQLLTTLCKILKECPIVRIAAFRNVLNPLWEIVRLHLLHPHIWVRLVSSQLFGMLFACYPPEEVASIANSKENKQNEYFLQNYPEKLRILPLDFFDQLKSAQLIPELGDQIARNLVYFAKLLSVTSVEISKAKSLKRKLDDSDDQSDKTNNCLSDLSIDWLFKNLSKIAQDEATSHKNSVLKRICFFKWIAAVVTVLGKDTLVDQLPHVVPHLTRASRSEKFANKDLKNLATGVLELLQNKAGVETFSKEYVKSSMEIARMKMKRKQKIATLAVKKPDVSARMKLKLRADRKKAKQRTQKLIREGKLIPKKHKRPTFGKKCKNNNKKWNTT